MYMTESPEACELLFDKMLMKLVSCKKAFATAADSTKREFSKFLKMLAHDNNEVFVLQ